MTQPCSPYSQVGGTISDTELKSASWPRKHPRAGIQHSFLDIWVGSCNVAIAPEDLGLAARKLERPTRMTTPLTERDETWLRRWPSGWECGEMEWVKYKGTSLHEAELSDWWVGRALPGVNAHALAAKSKLAMQMNELSSVPSSLLTSSVCVSPAPQPLDTGSKSSNLTAFQPSGLQWNAEILAYHNLMLAQASFSPCHQCPGAASRDEAHCGDVQDLLGSMIHHDSPGRKRFWRSCHPTTYLSSS